MMIDDTVIRRVDLVLVSFSIFGICSVFFSRTSSIMQKSISRSSIVKKSQETTKVDVYGIFWQEKRIGYYNSITFPNISEKLIITTIDFPCATTTDALLYSIFKCAATDPDA